MVKKKAVFILNPRAGWNRLVQTDRLINRYIDKSLYDYEIFSTFNKKGAASLAADSVIRGVDVIVAVGGDGTINTVARHIVGSKTAIAIIPTGSGNGLARHLDIPLSIRDAVRVINGGKNKLIDTATVNGHFFVSIAGLGFDALVSREFSNALIRGITGYFRVTLANFFRFLPLDYTLDLGGKKIERKAFFISITNSSQFGYNARISPEAKIDDGLFDICIVSKPGMRQLPRITKLLFTRRFHESGIIEIFRSPAVTIHSGFNQPVNVDGESLDLDCTRFEFTIRPASLSVIVP